MIPYQAQSNAVRSANVTSAHSRAALQSRAVNCQMLSFVSSMPPLVILSGSVDPKLSFTDSPKSSRSSSAAAKVTVFSFSPASKVTLAGTV